MLPVDIISRQIPGFSRKFSRQQSPKRGLCRQPKIVRMEAGIELPQVPEISCEYRSNAFAE